MFLKYLIFAFSFFVVCALVHAAQPGFLEGHLKIVSSKEVQLADETQSQDNTPNYADFPLLILSNDSKIEIARITADANGKYRIALPPGDYILDAMGRQRGRLRAKPELFKVVSNQTVRVNMTIDTGVR